MTYNFGDGFPSCAVITDKDTPLTVFIKSMQAQRVLDLRQDTTIDLEVLCRQGQKEYYASQMKAEKDRNTYVRKPI
jgi:hypothetical protein